MKKVLPEHAILIPENAQKVFTGQIFDVYQWNQPLFDGRPAVFEMLKRPDTLQVLAIKDGKLVLLTEEQPGRLPELSLPGGRAELSDQTWLEGAQREMLEETGMTFKSWKLLNVIQPVSKAEWFVVIFLASDFKDQVSQALDAGEKIKMHDDEYAHLRELVLTGKETGFSYLISTLNSFESLEELLAATEFSGMDVDR